MQAVANPETTRITGLPARGCVWGELRDRLLALRATDVPYRQGQFYYYWRKPGGNIWQAAQEAASLWAGQAYIGRARQPSIATITDELVAMAAGMLGVPAAGHLTLTSGGSESNFLAMLAARERARTRDPARRQRRANIIVPDSAHFSFGKSALYLDMDLIRVPLGADHRADARAMAATVNADTVAVVGSAPCFPCGVIDPIEDIAAIAHRHDLWFHVDACVGGFVTPYLRRLGVPLPPCGFDVPGVTSMSADLHKFGYAFPTVSTLAVAARDDAAFHNFHTASLLGPFDSNVFAGTRPASTLVAAWAVMLQLGDAGYLDAARRLWDHVGMLRRGIEVIPGLCVTIEPQSPLLLFTSRSMDIREVAQGMIAQGYPIAVYPLDFPQIHLIVDPLEDAGHTEDWLQSLTGVVDAVARGALAGATAQTTYG